MLDTTQSEAAPPKDEPRGCLFALSQPPLMIFLAVIGCLILMAARHDLLLLGAVHGRPGATRRDRRRPRTATAVDGGAGPAGFTRPDQRGQPVASFRRAR